MTDNLKVKTEEWAFDPDRGDVESCGECAEDVAPPGTEAGEAKLCRDCWDEANGPFGLGA
jgi:hypothetical protein